MDQRFDMGQVLPKAYQAMYGLESCITQSGLSKTHLELLKIRASQINGCAFCLDMHTKDALKQGETNQRIFLLNAWRETSLFTEQEKAVLAITEEITFISQNGLSEETYILAKQLFEEDYIAKIIMAVVAINAWNRIAISTNKQIE